MKRSPIDDAQRRVESWFRPEWKDSPGLDRDAYDRMVDQLVGAMNVVGHANSMEGVTALVKTLALMLAANLRLSDDEAAREVCSGFGSWIENEVFDLRKVMTRRNVKEH